MITQFLTLDFKRKSEFFFEGIIFSRGDLSWEGGGTIPKIVINLPRTYEKLHFKGESYRFSGYRDPLVQIDTQTHRKIYRDPVTF